jgi:hypothetical protein
MRFQPGQSGNPAGRPPGVRNKATVIAEELFDGEVEAIVRRAIDKAKEGDMAAVRLCLDRVAPRRRGCAVAFGLPPLVTAADAVTAMAAIVAGLGNGELTPAEASELAKLVERYTRALESSTLEARITKLEQEGNV